MASKKSKQAADTICFSLGFIFDLVILLWVFLEDCLSSD